MPLTRCPHYLVIEEGECIECYKDQIAKLKLDLGRMTDNHDKCGRALMETRAEAERAYKLFPPLLKGVCEALKGTPPPESLVMYDWSDLPVVAKQLVEKFDKAFSLLLKIQWVESEYKGREYEFCPVCGNINAHTHGCELGDFIYANCKHEMKRGEVSSMCTKCRFTKWDGDETS
jgi:hypothetical protein